MGLKPLKIGKHTIKYPIFQGGMGVGISWDRLAGNVSKEGALGIISAVGNEIFKNARKICGNNPLGANILYAINEYGRVVRDACEAGANIIVTGAGLPTNMPEFTKNFPDVALVPIVSSAKALKIICRRWMDRYARIPDAVIVEGPLSGGHQGFSYEDCFKEEYQLENVLPQVVDEAKKWGNIPVIAAGGIWDRSDIDRMLSLGASGVQMGTRWLGSEECDAVAYRDLMPSVSKEDIELVKSPVGYPARAVKTGIFDRIAQGNAPKIRCVSNCVSPCHRGVEAKKVGYCIADSLGRGFMGDREQGLYFTGANGYRIQKIQPVREIIAELVQD